MLLGNLFGWRRKRKDDPAIGFGRFSDNNKSVEQVGKWTEADSLFRNKQYLESLDCFFDYLKDERQDNVRYERNDSNATFQIYQGSKIVRGAIRNGRIEAEISLAAMPEPSVPVMRRLLEMNFNLFYTRYALHDDMLCMRFDSELITANPNKLYYGLKELATKADKQDDLLVQEFSALQAVDTAHISQIPEEEKEVKYRFFQEWISNTLAQVESLDSDKFAGAIAYLLLTLVFRLDYLICPEGKLLSELEKIGDSYYRKEEKSTVEKNQAMIDGFNRLSKKSKQDVFNSLFRSRHTFAIVTPHNQKSISEAITNAEQNMLWYRDNNHVELANKVLEYGLSFCQYSYSLPRPMTELYHLFMVINYIDYFRALGFSYDLYDPESGEFDSDEIIHRIDEIIADWREKYPRLSFRYKNLKFDSLVNFNHSFALEVAQLNFDI
jgi:hypothetical protein